LARRISAATGVYLRWLLANDLDADIVSSPDGRWLFTKSDFEHRQALKKIGSSEFVQYLVEDYAASFYGQIRALLSSAVKQDLADIAVWKIGKFLEDCRAEFGRDKGLIGSEEQFGLRDDDSPYLKERQVKIGIALFKQSDSKEHVEKGKRLFRDYNRKRAKIIREGLSAPKKRRKKSASATAADNSKHKRFIRERKKMLGVLDKAYRREHAKIIREGNYHLVPNPNYPGPDVPSKSRKKAKRR
jgi:hypothetical protein